MVPFSPCGPQFLGCLFAWTSVFGPCFLFLPPFLGVYDMNGFGTETMYVYYIAMKSMFLVAKLFSHLSIVYVNFTILLP